MSTLPRCALLEVLQNPGGCRPEKTQSEGKLAPLVLKKFEVNSEPKREMAAVPREANEQTSPENQERGGGQMSLSGRWLVY